MSDPQTPEEMEAAERERRMRDAALNQAAMNQTAAEEKVRAEKEAAVQAQKKADKVAAKQAKDAPDTSAAARLKTFEIEHLGREGKEPVRINGEIERGVGSPYAKLTDEQRAHYVALEKLVEAEAALDAANAAKGKAEADCKIATSAVETAGKKATEAEAAKEKADA